MIVASLLIMIWTSDGLMSRFRSDLGERSEADSEAGSTLRDNMLLGSFKAVVRPVRSVSDGISKD